MKRIKKYSNLRLNMLRAIIACIFLSLAYTAHGAITGSVLDSFRLPWAYDNIRVCQDLAYDGSYLWCINSNPHEDIFKLERIFYDKQTHTGVVVSSFNLPGGQMNDEYFLNELKGLTWDGTYLGITYGEQTGAIFFLNPSNPGTYVSSFVPTGFRLPYGLGYQPISGETGYLWSVSNDNGYVFKMNRSDGSIIASFPTANDMGVGRKPAGLTFDGNYIWIAGFGKNDRFFGYTTSGSLIGTFAPPTAQSFPTGITWADNDFWYVDACTDTFYRIRILYN